MKGIPHCNRQKLAFLAIGGIALFAPYYLTNEYTLYILNMILIYSILGISQNVITGYAGQLSVGQAGFFAIGAYSAAVLSVKCGFPGIVEIAGVLVISLVAGFIIGAISLRMTGATLAITTIGFARTVQLVLINAEDITGGTVGFNNIPGIFIGKFEVQSPGIFYYISFLSLICVLILTSNLVRSRVGRGIIATRESEIAANVIGINPTKYKIVSFMFSAVIGGFAGYLYAHFAGSLFPSYFSVWLSVLILFTPLIGGMGTLFGPILGSIILVLGFEVFRGFQEYQMVSYGIILVLFSMFLPFGIIRLLKQGMSKIT